MEIQIRQTPNPNALKFVLPARCFSAPLNFSNADAAAAHELAARLFATGGVYNVFFAQDFVTVNKYPDRSWDALTGSLERIIADYFG